MIKKFLVLSLLIISFSAVAEGDPWKAVYGFQSKLAKQGNAEAQYKLGEMCEDGRGTRKNYKDARNWYQKAANQGHAAATYKLGRLYEKGLGVSPNKQKALRLYEEAANQGNPDARARLEKWRRKKDNDVIEAKSQQEKRGEKEEALRAEKKKQEQEKARKAALAKKHAAQERARKAALAKKHAEQERARKAALAKKRAEQEKARKAELAKKQAKENASHNRTPVAKSSTVPEKSSTTGNIDTKRASSEGHPLDKASGKSGGDSDAFESDPCKTPAARFMSTCRGK